MQIIQTIISYLAIAAAFISSIFSFGDTVTVPFANKYEIPESIPEYSVISTDEKTSEKYVVSLSLPKDMKAVLYIPDGADVKINSEIYYQNGSYANSVAAGNVEIIET